jgi:catechol 2,3-dioxygenase-like lactoylglutathione lyase family enzyme
MRFEHIALMMSDPVSSARWYADNLGFTVLRASDKSPFGHFLEAPGAGMMFELYNNPSFEVPDYSLAAPAQFHLAFTVDDVACVRERLLAAGAQAVGEVESNELGDTLAMLRDPWGVPLQLICRVEAILSE